MRIHLYRNLSVPHLKKVGKCFAKKAKNRAAGGLQSGGKACILLGMDTFLTHLPVAHRGLHDETRPENSMSAFLAAADAGYAIETDVRYTKDKKIVLMHDDELERMCGDGRSVSSMTLSELASVRLAGTEEKIPTIEEFLAGVAGRVPLLIEIKSMENVSPEEICADLKNALAGYKGEYAVQSFQPFYVKEYKRICPEIMCGVLSSAGMKKTELGAFWRIKAYLLKNLKLNVTVKPDFISYNVEDLPQRAVTNFKGIKLGWTVRSEEAEARARQYVDNIIFEHYLAQK